MKQLFASFLAAFAICAGAQTPFLSVASSPTGAAGSVTSVSVTPSNGITGTVTTATTTPAIALSLGAITPTTVNKVTITAPASSATLTIANGKTFTANNSVALSGTDGTTFTTPGQSASAVPYLGAMAYASLPACNSTNDGYKAFVTDWGVNGTEARCRNAITRWMPTNGVAVLKRLLTPVSGVANTETVITQIQLPIGVPQASDVFRVVSSVAKSGTTDNCQHALHVGTAGTTSDAAVMPLVNTLVTTNLSGGPISAIRVASTTSMQKTGSNATGSAYGGPGNVALATAVTVPDASANALWLSYSLKSSSTNDTCSVQEVTITQEVG